MPILSNVGEVIGNTPVVWLNKSVPKDVKAKIAVKLESENPGKSVKDRLALSMIELGEAQGVLVPGKSVLVEATSGNTGIALAMLGAAKGYKVILVMPETMSLERRVQFRIFGAEVVLTPKEVGLQGALYISEKIARETPNAVLTKQFSTEANAKVHRETTGPELWEQTDGKVDIIVSGVGTGGTLTGVAQYFKSKGSKAEIIAVEPAESPVISGGKPGPHKIQGIGAGFIPEVLDTSLITRTVPVSSEDAFEVARDIPKKDGILVGISAGAILKAAFIEGAKPENEGKTIVAFVPSYGERYFSTALFTEVYEEAKNLPVLSQAESTRPEGEEKYYLKKN